MARRLESRTRRRKPPPKFLVLVENALDLREERLRGVHSRAKTILGRTVGWTAIAINNDGPTKSNESKGLSDVLAPPRKVDCHSSHLLLSR